MRLPKDLLSQTYTKPKLFLCEIDKTKICQLETVDMQGSFKFNAYSELTFTVGRTYVDTATGEIRVNPHYNKIEALRLVYLEGFGYFEIQEPEIFSDGIQESKNITAYGLEYRLAQRYIEGIKINTGDVDSVEVIVAGKSEIIPVTLLNNVNENLSLLDIVLEKIYDWSIGHVDDSLKSLSRQFDISRASVYDFIVQDICDKFNCYAIFDTINNKINLYAEALVSKHTGDGTTTSFTVSPIFNSLGSVSIGSYKTTKYTYDSESGILTFDEAPENGAKIEIVDGSQEKWQTDVYVTFDNLAQEVNVSYSAEDIKTVLTVKGQDGLNIREVNMGLPYIVDLSYYHTVDWMGQGLYDAYTEYLKKSSKSQSTYTDNSKQMLELAGKITYEKERLSLQYSIANNVTSTTVGTYYVRGGEVILTKEQEEIAKIMEKEFPQTSIDLIARPEVSWEKMHEAGWDTEQGTYSTLHTVTFLYSDFCTIEDGQKDYAINVTPILPNGYVISGGHDGLFDYIDKKLKDGISFQHMGNIFIGIYDSLDDAEAAAERLHVLQEQFYQYGFPVPNYYYREVKLPSEYNAKIKTYYTLFGNDLNENKFSKLYEALQTYFVSEDDKDVSNIEDVRDSFLFIDQYAIDSLIAELSDAESLEQKNNAILNFLDKIWDQLGKTPLETLYLKTYKTVESTNTEAGWNDKSNENYWRYYPVTLVIESLNKEIDDRKSVIDSYQAEYDLLQEANNEIAKNASIYNVFSKKQLARLSPFFREDEYTDDNFIETDSDTIEMLMKTKQELLECGRIELSKLCEPKLEFSMDMANIYALEEFEPIIDQFQLGNFINVVIRPDYVKKARLLSVDINFDDFSDFSCEFGELTSLKTQSSIHADLLAAALTAGNSVASSQSYWEKGVDLATSTDLKIQSGLLNAIDGIYSADKSVLIDNHGIRLRKIEDGGEFSPYQIWLTNNNILVSTDGFDTAKTGIGVFEINGKERYGVLAEAVISGYIESSTIVGGTINIGDGKFTVDKFGNVTMNAASINGYVEKNGVISSINQSSEKVSINADKISLAGKTIDLTSDNITINSTNFSVTKDGLITAKSGNIADWSITNNKLMKELTLNDIDYRVYLQSPDGGNAVNAFAIRTKSTSSSTWETQFSVNYKGKLFAKDADITGSITANSLTLGSAVAIPYSKLSGTPDLSIYIYKDGTIGSTPTSGSTGFKVSSSGLLQASNAVIYGTLYSTAGEIGGWTIYDGLLRKEIKIDNVDYQMYLQAADGVNTTNAFAVRKKNSSDTSWDVQFSVNYAGKMTAKNANIIGTITAKDGSIAGYNIGPGGSYDNALYKRVSGDDTDYEVGLKATNGDTDLAFYVKESTDGWSSSSNTFYVRNNGQLYAKNADITGKITASSGSIGGCSISDGVLNISAANITSGTIATARIPNLSADKITAGTIDVDRIPNISADKITSGTISTSRLSSSVITTSNFSSKDLSTGNLTVTGGSKLGFWTVTSSGGLTCGSGTSSVGMSSSGVSHGSGWTATWYDIIQAGNAASDERLKTDITEFEDSYDNIFDSLKPVHFKYTIEPEYLRFGFVAQDVKENFEEKGINNFGGVYAGEGDDAYYRLLQEDFIALNTWQIQKLKSRVEELEKKLAELEA